MINNFKTRNFYMLQNRVNPFGELIKTPERGAWIGNRGVIHNEKKEITHFYKIKAWITCALEFRGWHREVMQPDRWTELFFFDEATAFSAGHRPCFQCRYLDHQRFKEFWIKGNPEYGFDMKTPVAKIDEIIHRERMGSDKSKITFEENFKNLPVGTFVNIKNTAHLIMTDDLYQWSAKGYVKIEMASLTDDIVTVITPRSIVNMLKAGYQPQIGHLADL